MNHWIRRQLFKIVLWASNRFASSPKQEKVFAGLDKLLRNIEEGKESKGSVVRFDCVEGRFIIFSDQHKGTRNGADDFALCERNYLAALEHYHEGGFSLLALGDVEELWENKLSKVVKQQEPSFRWYQTFAANARFYKTIGNHDLDWKNDPWTLTQIEKIFAGPLTVCEGVLLQTEIGGKPLRILCTHGHQGDGAADGNWFSKFFVSKVWAPLQSWLKINPNTPAYDAQLKTLHNRLMYAWSAAQHNLLLVTGHTHQPVFESLTHIERLYRQLLLAQAAGDKELEEATVAEIKKRKFAHEQVSQDYLSLRPSYFNSGCCCFNDGDITGLEIDCGHLRLVKWAVRDGAPKREVLEDERLEVLLNAVSASVTVVPQAAQASVETI